MTASEYHRLVKNYDRDRVEKLLAQIPLNINRAGKLYKKLVKEIYEQNKSTTR